MNGSTISLGPGIALVATLPQPPAWPDYANFNSYMHSPQTAYGSLTEVQGLRKHTSAGQGLPDDFSLDSVLGYGRLRVSLVEVHIRGCEPEKSNEEVGLRWSGYYLEPQRLPRDPNPAHGLLEKPNIHSKLHGQPFPWPKNHQEIGNHHGQSLAPKLIFSIRSRT